MIWKINTVMKFNLIYFFILFIYFLKMIVENFFNFQITGQFKRPFIIFIGNIWISSFLQQQMTNNRSFKKCGNMHWCPSINICHINHRTTIKKFFNNLNACMSSSYMQGACSVFIKCIDLSKKKNRSENN